MKEHDDINAMLRGLKDSPTILAAFVKKIPDDVLYARRAEGCWSIAEHVAHLAEVQPMGLERINRILDEDTPEFAPYFPDEEDSTKAAPLPAMGQALADFKAGRNAILERLDPASNSDWQRTAVHPEYREYGLHIFARHLLMHDHWHMYRMEELWLTRDAYFTAP